MNSSAFIRSLYAKCKMHGAGEAQIVLSDGELHAIISIAFDNLGWDHDEIGIARANLPSSDYYKIPMDWFIEKAATSVSTDGIISALMAGFAKDNDFGLFIENLSSLHRRRVKYGRILSSQPLPNMDQIGPRALLEYGGCNEILLANWMVWRKWVYDIDNRSAQETGYLFEPLIASCLGGKPVSSRNSPVKRLDNNGRPTNQGRQIDCLVPINNRTYEIKLRVTIAASGQGRFGEELSFAKESQAAGFTPVLLVLDPTPSSRLSELSQEFLACGGFFYHGDKAWEHMEKEAGGVISIFIERYIKPAIQSLEEVEIEYPRTISLSWSDQEIAISDECSSYVIRRQ